MERFIPNFFILMIILWVMGVYYIHDIVYRINHDQTFHVHFQLLLHRLKNTSNHTI